MIRALPRRAPVALMYHAFGSRPTQDDPYFLFVSAEAFREQLSRLRGRGWHALDLGDYIQGLGRSSPGRPSFLVTIDDGFTSVLDIAAPILASQGVPAVLFVPPSLIGATSSWMPDMADEPLLDADGLRALVSLGVELGVHGSDHRSMTDMSDADLRTATIDSRQALADITGVVPRSFAYPSGAFDRRAMAAVESAGYDVAFATTRGAGRFAVPRIEVHARDTARLLELKLVPGYRQVWRLGERARPLRAWARRRLEGGPVEPG